MSSPNNHSRAGGTGEPRGAMAPQIFPDSIRWGLTKRSSQSRSLTLFPLGGGRCVSLQLEFVSILTGLEFCGWKLYDNFILCIPQVSEALVLKIIIKNLSNFKFENFLSPFFFYNLFFLQKSFIFLKN